VLTVKDGSAIAQITLEGAFTRSTFTLSSDGHGGTTVVDPPATGAADAAAVHRFVAASAALKVGPAEASVSGAARAAHPPLLARPGASAG
jgi:hypothetical protein